MLIQPTCLLGMSEEGVKVYDVVLQVAEGPRTPCRFVLTHCCGLSQGPLESRAMPLTPMLCYLLKQ